MIKKILLLLCLVSNTLIFSQEEEIQSVIVSPSPFSQHLTFHIKALKQVDVKITIKNVLGKTVYNQQYIIDSGLQKIPFLKNNLKSGMYVYAIQTRNQLISKRFVIK